MVFVRVVGREDKGKFGLRGEEGVDSGGVSIGLDIFG